MVKWYFIMFAVLFVAMAAEEIATVYFENRCEPCQCTCEEQK